MIRMTNLVLFFSFILSTNLVLARKNAAFGKENITLAKIWERGEQSVVELNLSSTHKAQCKHFEIKIDSHLHLNIDCDGVSRSEKISLTAGAQYTVSQTKEQWTLIKYNYLHKKPQTSRLTQTLIKIPYVEEVIHIKKQGQDELAFYLEAFKVDEFGRIVQNKYIQAHGLKTKELKVSSN